MFDVGLDLTLEVVVIFETFLEFKVNKETIVAVEAQEVITVCLVGFELALKADRVAAVDNVRRSAIDAMAILVWHEWVNMNAVFVIMNGL